MSTLPPQAHSASFAASLADGTLIVPSSKCQFSLAGWKVAWSEARAVGRQRRRHAAEHGTGRSTAAAHEFL
jgi:hypothetical protein